MNLEERIEELEKNQKLLFEQKGEWLSHCNYNVIKNDSIFKEIAELEKNQKILQQLIPQEWQQKENTKQIAELRALIQKIGVKLDFTSDESGQALKEILELEANVKLSYDYYNIHREEIAELEKDVKRNDSKPPELYKKDRRCPKQKSLDTTGCNCIDYKQQECKTCPYYPNEDRLPGGTGKEPRENYKKYPIDKEYIKTELCQKTIDRLISEFVKILKKADYMKYPNAYLKQQIKEYEEKLK